jgi:hypothetical protein
MNKEELLAYMARSVVSQIPYLATVSLQVHQEPVFQDYISE